jgi:hypothetical protein
MHGFAVTEPTCSEAMIGTVSCVPGGRFVSSGQNVTTAGPASSRVTSETGVPWWFGSVKSGARSPVRIARSTAKLARSSSIFASYSAGLPAGAVCANSP